MRIDRAAVNHSDVCVCAWGWFSAAAVALSRNEVRAIASDLSHRAVWHDSLSGRITDYIIDGPIDIAELDKLGPIDEVWREGRRTHGPSSVSSVLSRRASFVCQDRSYLPRSPASLRNN